MMETEQGDSGSCRQISAQSSEEYLVTIWMELFDWGTIAINSAGRFLTAMLNLVMLAIAATIAVFAVIVLDSARTDHKTVKGFDVFTSQRQDFLEEDRSLDRSFGF